MKRRADAGTALPLVVYVVVVILALAAAFAYVDARVRAYLLARDVAQSAAEAAAQRLDQDALHRGVLEIDPDAAVEAVRTYLAGVGSEGRIVEIGSTTAPSSCGMDLRSSPPRWRSCVRVEVQERFGPGDKIVKATGTARPVAGVRQEEP